MYPYYTEAFQGPQAGDIACLQFVYGVPVAPKPSTWGRFGLCLAAHAQTPAASALRSSSNPHFERGQKRWWLLRAKPGRAQAIHLADNPQRLVSGSRDAVRITSRRRLIGR